MLQGGFNDNFSVHVYPLKTLSVRHISEVLKNIWHFTIIVPKVDDWVYFMIKPKAMLELAWDF